MKVVPVMLHVCLQVIDGHWHVNGLVHQVGKLMKRLPFYVKEVIREVESKLGWD